MNHEELCLSCGECCRALILYAPRPGFLLEPQAEAWMAARGLTVLERLKGWYRVSLQAPCPHLAPGEPWKCDIYETRPEACRTFDGRTEPSLNCPWEV